MKRILAFLVAVIMVISLAACSATVECDECGDEVDEEDSHSVKGDVLCDDCYDDYREEKKKKEEGEGAGLGDILSGLLGGDDDSADDGYAYPDDDYDYEYGVDTAYDDDYDYEYDVYPDDEYEEPVETEYVPDISEEYPAEESEGITLGKVKDGRYSNEFFGISFDAPSGWAYMSEEEILAINNVTSGYYDEATAELLRNATIVYDMYANSSDGTESININAEKIAQSQLATISLEQILSAQIETIVSVYEGIGYTDIEVKYQKVQVDGKTFDALVTTANIFGFDFYGVCFSFLKENYMVNVTVGSAMGSVTHLIDRFTVK